MSSYDNLYKLHRMLEKAHQPIPLETVMERLVFSKLA